MRQGGQLAGIPGRLRHPLPAHMVDRAPHHLSQRLESGVLNHAELVDAQIARKYVAGRALPGGLFLQSIDRIDRQPATFETSQALLSTLFLSGLIGCLLLSESE